MSRALDHRKGVWWASVPWNLARAYAEDCSFPEPLASYVFGAIRARDVEGLGAITSRFPEYHGTRTWLALRQVEAFFKKNESFADNKRCEIAAWETFQDAEKRCRITNRRIAWYSQHTGRLDPELLQQIQHMQKDIQSLLGCHKVFLDRLPDLLKVTGGATADRSRTRALPFLKITRRVKAPSACIPLIDALSVVLGVRLRFQPTEVNRIEFVQKNWKTHRTIACEATHVVPFQLAGDTYIKRRLLRWGVTLTDQRPNQRAALQGSLDGSIATVDMRTASDTVALNAVAWLFPDSWFALLARLRSRGYKCKFGTGEYAKFSSMGNGLTFVLESTIFAAACRAVQSEAYRVYGDDIAIEAHLVEKLLRLLRFLGFSVNMEKTYTAGPFRESCGNDYFNGEYVTPVYVRRTPKQGESAHMCHIVNSFLPVSIPGGRLRHFLLETVQKLRLPLVPFQEDTMVGIHIPPSVAYQRKLLSNIPVSRESPFYGPTFKGFVPRGELRYNGGWRSYFLASRSASRRLRLHHPFRLPPGFPEGAWGGGVESDSTQWSSGFVRYRKTRVPYSPAQVGIPPHLWAVSDELTEAAGLLE